MILQFTFVYLVIFLNQVICDPPGANVTLDRNISEGLKILSNTRRIISGHEAADTRPYMVFLRAAPGLGDKKPTTENTWLCGGVIIHPRFILTSAACIENVQHFLVVSGTHKWVPAGLSNDCITNGAKKAVWKCVAKSYVYDGNEFDNIRWMISDIAVVKVEDDFNFNRRVRGCDFVPKMVSYNNQSIDLEKPRTIGSIAGWGSNERFSEVGTRSIGNSPDLMETDVVILSKTNCKKRWPARYHHIIDNHMLCGKDTLDSEVMDSVCSDQEINCKELVYSQEESDEDQRRFIIDPEKVKIYGANRSDNPRRSSKVASGGFCENDHGGPFVVGHGKTSVVVGIISACQTHELTYKCFGPFLYTSVYNNRHLISCAIDKDVKRSCRAVLRAQNTHAVETNFDWSEHQFRSFKRHQYDKKDIYENQDPSFDNNDTDSEKSV